MDRVAMGKMPPMPPMPPKCDPDDSSCIMNKVQMHIMTKSSIEHFIMDSWKGDTSSKYFTILAVVAIWALFQEILIYIKAVTKDKIKKSQRNRTASVIKAGQDNQKLTAMDNDERKKMI